LAIEAPPLPTQDSNPLLEPAPPPPDSYRPEILEEAPPPPPMNNPIQQSVLLSQSSISSLKLTMIQGFGQIEKIMTATNSIAGTVKEIIDILKQLPNNQSAVRLSTTLYEQVKQLGSVARVYVGQLKDTQLFGSLITVIDTILTLIAQYVPYIIN